MRFMGSKAKHAKDILPIVLKDRKPGQWYVEPLVGGCNTIDKVDGNRIGSDSNRYVIALYKAILSGWVPPSEFSEEEYIFLKEHKDQFEDYLVGFVGFGCSYGGKFFGGYARTEGRNICEESKRNILKQAVGLKGVHLHHCSYTDLILPSRSIIYCDPPYQGTTQYAGDKFDYDVFWNWVRAKTRQNHSVFVSEYQAPEDFKCVWEKTVNNTLVKDTGSKQGVEKLFVHNSKL